MLTRMRWMVVAGVVAASAPVHADEQGHGTWASYGTTALYNLDEGDAPDQIVFAGVRGSTFIGSGVAYHFHVDAGTGSTFGGTSFYYQLGLLPLGVALKLDEGAGLALGTGVAFSGAIGSLDDAVALPLDASFQFKLGEKVRILGHVRGSVLAGADPRQAGSNIPYIDELDASLALRIGSSMTGFGASSGTGYFGGFAYREMMGAKFVGLVLGYASDAGFD